MKILCVCTSGINRSRTCADILKEKGYQAYYQGVDSVKVTDIYDIDMLIVFEPYINARLEYLAKWFHKPVFLMLIEDNYQYNDSELITKIKESLVENRFI